MATPYSVKITMSKHTVDLLSAGGFKLYGFKAVQATAGGGAPLVWFQTKTFSTTTSVNWKEQYQAYTSQEEITHGVTISSIFPLDIDLDETLSVDNPDGTGVLKNGGSAGAISIENKTTTQLTCGISEKQGDDGGSPTPLCAFPLFGNGLDVIAPVEKVLLTFATSPVNTGTVIEQAFAQGYLIDLTDAPDNTRSVAFDINEGWSNADNAAWGKPVPANADLPSLLINSSPSAVRAMLTKAA